LKKDLLETVNHYAEQLKESVGTSQSCRGGKEVEGWKEFLETKRKQRGN
jgi:hypothetical protein